VPQSIHERRYEGKHVNEVSWKNREGRSDSLLIVPQTLKAVLVFVPDRRNQYTYEIGAASSYDAARQAIEVHEQHHPKLTDDTVFTIILGGKSPLLWDADTHNASNPRSSIGSDKCGKVIERQTAVFTRFSNNSCRPSYCE